MGTSALSIAESTCLGTYQADARLNNSLQPPYWWVSREYVDINFIICDVIAVEDI